MDQNVDMHDKKNIPLQETRRVDLDFISAINDRQFGFMKQNCGSMQINITAEDELVKKQFTEKHCELPGVPRSTFLMEFSPDGTKVASTHGNHQIYVTDVRSGKHIKTLIGHPRTPWCIAFHPTSNQIIASGCLGGQVRIWDLSGGSEVWTSETPSVIASIAFHPDDRLLVIATFNELFFWDWSKPEPFVHIATSNVKEKVRYVAFDKLGHKLITGITNSPQTRWERVHTVPVSVSVPVPTETQPGFHTRRLERQIITPRFNWLASNSNNTNSSIQNDNATSSMPTATSNNPGPFSSVPERERRITSCYRELVHQYEVLVHRYLQIYRRPIMIDQGTDPMEMETSTVSCSNSLSRSNTRPDSPIPSTSGVQRPLRKSTTAHSSKNRRPFLHEESGDSSSSSSPDLSRNTSAGPQVSRMQDPKALNGNTSKQINFPDKKSWSSSEDDDDFNHTCSKSRVKQCTPTRQLKLKRTRRIKLQDNSKEGTRKGNGNEEPKSEIHVKCLVTPNHQLARNAGSSPSNNLLTNVGNSSGQREDINPLTNNANLKLTNYESLQHCGLQVRAIHQPSLSPVPPSTTASRPSRGTNTSDFEGVPNRKRRLLRPNLLGNILFTSSDESSSEETTGAVPVAKPVENSSTTTSLEHSYAGVDDADQSTTSSAVIHRPSRKRRLLSELELSTGSCSKKSDDLTKIRILPQSSTQSTEVQSFSQPATSTVSNDDSHNQVDSLMDRHMQRLVVESLSVLDGPTSSDITTLTNNTSTTTMAGSGNRDGRKLCGSCGGQLENNVENRASERCVRSTISCMRTHAHRLNTSMAYPPPRLSPSRRRFFSHRLSAFHPTRFLNRMLRGRAISSTSLHYRESPMPTILAEDEVINYSERDGEERRTSSNFSATRGYHPFHSPPDMLSLNPENIGIGNMYSNIVQELESSLNDVRNIRFRLGEMSVMLSNFSDRLENIMSQSNTILRNLNSSMVNLPVVNSERQPPPTQLSQRSSQVGLSDPSSYSFTLEDIMHSSTPWIGAYRPPYVSNNPVNSDHTYPINMETTQNATLSPLHLSLQLTVTHIQRQARLLRQQVESIERIDRAMIEVAQLQMMRQMFDELHMHFGADSLSSTRNGVSSMRQMMAGTRITDSSPCDSPVDERTDNSRTVNVSGNIDSQPSTSSSNAALSGHSETARNATQVNCARNRKNYPRCLFLMHRQYHRSARRNAARDRSQMRRNIYRRFLSSTTPSRATIGLSTPRGRDLWSLSLFNPDTLQQMARRVEHHLMEHGRYIGRSTMSATSDSNCTSNMGEHVLTLRLNNCRMRMNNLMGNFQLENSNTSVTADGTSRYAARLALSSTLDAITRFVEINPNMTISTLLRSQIWEVIELSLLLSELLLLQIVDSIPPPSGMNLDPERENLSMRIDQMCTRMISLGQSNQLARSLRLMRLTVRHATRTLGRTYTQRRNAMLPTYNERDHVDSRQGLLLDIHNCLRNIRRYRAADRLNDSNFRDWYRTINDLISRYTTTRNGNNPGQSPLFSAETPTTVLSHETGEEIRTSMVTVEDANSSDDNSNNDLAVTMRPNSMGLYQLSRLQTGDNVEEGSYRNPTFLNVPTVQINDVPLPDAPHPWRVRNTRQRLSERLDELRTVGLLRPRFLHPMYSGVVNPFAFEENMDEAHREPIYDSDVIPTVTPNHRIQVWEFSQVKIPNISNSQKNLVVNECKIHNDASVDYASDGSILVTLLPSGGYMNVTNRLGVYSLEWQTLGQCLYVTSFEQNAVSVSLSPTNRHLLVGLASRRVSVLPVETWTMARIFLLDYKSSTHGNLVSIRELEQNRDTNFMSLNCIRWLPTAGQGLIFGTNTGHLRLLT